MQCNVGKTDKTIRFVLAVVIAGLGVYFGSWVGAIAIVPLATALFGTCPLYSILGISTNK